MLDCGNVFVRVIFLDPPGLELGATTHISGACALLLANTDTTEKGSLKVNQIKTQGTK